LFQQTSQATGMEAVIVEKDFWVCWTLKELFGLPTIGEHLIFKRIGVTSALGSDLWLLDLAPGNRRNPSDPVFVDPPPLKALHRPPQPIIQSFSRNQKSDPNRCCCSGLSCGRWLRRALRAVRPFVRLKPSVNSTTIGCPPIPPAPTVRLEAPCPPGTFAGDS